MAPWRWTPLPGRHEKLGASLRARFTLPEDPSILKFSMPRTKSAGRADFASLFRDGRFWTAPGAVHFADSLFPAASSSPNRPPDRDHERRTPALSPLDAPDRPGAQ